MIETRTLEVDRSSGRYYDAEFDKFIVPSRSDFEIFSGDHSSERWFMARVISDWGRMLPPTCVDPETGFDDFDMEVFIHKYGVLTAQEMFEEGEIDWADETSPVNGRPYLELRLEPSVRS